MGSRHVLTIFAVRSLENALRLYAAFEWKQVVATEVYAEFLVPGGMRFGLYQRSGFGRNIGREPIEVPHGEVGSAELYLHCDELREVIERLKRAGARELSPLAPRDWGDEAAYFADHDGHVLALSKPLA